MRTFHIGGTASKSIERTSINNRYPGTVRFLNLNTVRNREGDLVAMNRNGEISIVSESGRERERYVINYGAKLKVENGQQVEADTLLAEWDPFTTPILTDVAGTVKFGDIVEGQTMQEKLDPVTGKSSKVVVEYREADVRPRISIKDEKGKTARVGEVAALRVTSCRVGAILMVQRRGPDLSRRRSGKNPSRNDEDQGHHGWSAAGRGTFRGAKTQGKCGHYRDRRDGQLRQGHQGQAQGHRCARRGRSSRLPDSQGEAHQRA